MMPSLRALAPLAMVVVLCACGTASPTASTPGAVATTSPSPSALPSPSIAPSIAPSVAPTVPPIAAEPPPLGLAEVASGLSQPIGITGTPDGWLLVNERDGRVTGFDPQGGATNVALDITDRVMGGGEQGLLGLALHPGWPDTGRAFIHYTDLEGNSVISEFAGSTDGAGATTLDAASERVLLRVPDPYANHNGGRLAFGPDGYLYIGLGDGGSGGDPLGNGQDPSTLLGSILRVDVDGAQPYAIPDGNPFATGGGAPEVFLIGLRNPWQFSFDRETGLLWIADVGQNAWEEIDRVDPAADAGANLGWNLMEGTQCFTSGCSPDGLVLPVAEYGREVGCSITGGFVYRGSAIPQLRGWYLAGDYCSGLLLAVRADAAPTVAPLVVLQTGTSVSAFGEGSDGELYLADINDGRVYRIVPAP